MKITKQEIQDMVSGILSEVKKAESKIPVQESHDLSIAVSHAEAGVKSFEAGLQLAKWIKQNIKKIMDAWPEDSISNLTIKQSMFDMIYKPNSLKAAVDIDLLLDHSLWMKSLTGEKDYDNAKSEASTKLNALTPPDGWKMKVDKNAISLKFTYS